MSCAFNANKQYVGGIGSLYYKPIKAFDYVALRHLELGFRYKPSFSSIDIRLATGGVIKGNLENQLGFGTMLAYHFTAHIGLQTEVDYFELSQTFLDGDMRLRVDLGYMNIPILVPISTNKLNWLNWNFVVGPQLGLNVGTKLNNTSSSDSSKAVIDVKSGDIGFAYGTGLEVALNAQPNFGST